MPAPTQQLASLRPDIAEGMEEFDLVTDRDSFVAEKILPRMSVTKASGNFGRIPAKELLKNPETERAPGAGFGRGRWKFEPDTYATKEHGWEEAVDNVETKLYADYFDGEMISASLAEDVVLRDWETRTIAAVLDTAVMTGDLTSALATRWSDPASTPITDVKGLKRTIWARCGMYPDALVIDTFTFQDLQMNEEFIDKITSNGAGTSAKPSDITEAMMAQLLQLREVIVAGGTKNSANQGQSTATFDSIWPRTQALLFRKHRSPSLKLPGFGRTMLWQEFGPDQPLYESYDDPAIDGRWIRRRQYDGPKLLLPECAHRITNVRA